MRMLLVVLILAGAFLPAAGHAQEQEASGRATAVGLYGFGARAGVDFEGAGQAIVSIAVDAGHVFTDRLRLRPSGGCCRSQSTRGTTPNMAPPSKRKRPSLRLRISMALMESPRGL